MRTSWGGEAVHGPALGLLARKGEELFASATNMEFHGPVVCTTGHDNTPMIPCLDFTSPFANNGSLVCARCKHGADFVPWLHVQASGTNTETPTPATNGRNRRANRARPNFTRLRTGFKFEVRAVACPARASDRLRRVSTRKTTALAWRAVAGFGFGTGILPAGTPRREARSIRPTGPSPRRPGRQTRLRHGRPCPPGPCDRSRPRPASGHG